MSATPLRQICVVTGSRADYGLLKWPMRAIAADPALKLQVAVTGMHLAPEFGDTVRQIEADGFSVDARVDSLLSGDSPQAVTKSIGLGVVGFADVFARLRPDIALVLGDRFEILAAVQAALIAGVPIAHLCGGDTTEGAFDEMIRHAITKMAHIHLVTNSQAAARIRQMGEDPLRIFDVGSPGLDAIRHTRIMAADELFQAIGFTPRRRNILVGYHPVTLEAKEVDEAGELISALDDLGSDYGILITGSNADTAGRALNARLRQFAADCPNALFVQSLGTQRYINALRHFDVLVGNSSSGLYEAPTLGIPTIDVGDRQKGRLRGASVLWSEGGRQHIRDAIETAIEMGRLEGTNPYGDGHSSERIVRILREAPAARLLLRKPFIDL